MKLYAHPFSSFCQKALIALYENDTPFAFRLLEGKAALAELKTLWPIGKFPVLQDGERTVVEASAIIEDLAVHHPGPVRLIPDDPRRRRRGADDGPGVRPLCLKPAAEAGGRRPAD